MRLCAKTSKVTMPRKTYSAAEVEHVVRLSSQGQKNAQISRCLDIPPSVVCRMLKRVAERGTTEPRKGEGRPRKTTPRTDRAILNAVKAEPFIQVERIKSELQLSITSRTVINRLNEAGGAAYRLQSYHAAKMPKISAKHRQAKTRATIPQQQPTGSDQQAKRRRSTRSKLALPRRSSSKKCGGDEATKLVQQSAKYSRLPLQASNRQSRRKTTTSVSRRHWGIDVK
ncbi:uncharacterized protein LOC131259862 [Anopheles coustani]|uniref:uncharacterized protein LOC131259862 n=1 Tax=Anopheles coustani TaxID=139045 RepID=UPI0026580C28|nr:uncharacterized protein LOC131259862 [Anopheles coustani]